MRWTLSLGLVATVGMLGWAASDEAVPDLGADLVIETERGALRESEGPTRVDVIVDAAIPLGPTPIRVRVRGVALQDVSSVEIQVDGQALPALRQLPFEVEYDFGRTPQGHEIVATARLRSGEVLRGSRVTRNPASMMLTTGVEVVEVSIIVKDGDGFRVRDLSRSDFVVLEDGVEQEVRDFVHERAPLSLVLVLDSSGSMEGRLWSLKKAAIDFVDKVDPDVPVQVVDFDHDIRLQQEFTLDRSMVKKAINRLEVGGGTHLWDAAYSGAFALTGRDTRRAVVLFTDGVDQSEGDEEERMVSGIDEVVDVARQDRVQFYCIGFGRKIDEENMTRLSEQTGGVYYHATSTRQFREVYDSILADVAAQYVLTYQPSNTAQDGSVRRIEVKLSRAGLTPIYRKEYRAAGQ